MLGVQFRSQGMDFKFTQTGKYLIAAGSDREHEAAPFNPVLYISVVGEKGWATRYPMDGSFKGENEAAAAALHYGIQIITRQIKTVKQPGL
jgi:hypothetical protein